MTVTLLTGDVRDVLPTLPAESVHCVVTSPPYWGLRDYGTAIWEGGDAACDHSITRPAVRKLSGGCASWSTREASLVSRDVCRKCGARRIDRQLGLEATPSCGGSGLMRIRRALTKDQKERVVQTILSQDALFRKESIPNNLLDCFESAECGECHVCSMVEVFRAVRRALRKDGTCWVNYGDCFKDKQLIGMPWRIALALQADGWWLRSDIIWSKPNPMPESVTDRPTKSHEYVFLLTKSTKYFYDAEAVRESAKFGHRDWSNSDNTRYGRGCGANDPSAGRNLHSVWTIATAPFSEAHFATFPPKLAEICILAGTSAKGCCPACGAPWVRVMERTSASPGQKPGYLAGTLVRNDGDGAGHFVDHRSIDRGFRPSCACPPTTPAPCTILDPFSGAGTTLMVADRLQRHAIGIDLNTEYAAMAVKRIEKDQGPLFAEVL